MEYPSKQKNSHQSLMSPKDLSYVFSCLLWNSENSSVFFQEGECLSPDIRSSQMQSPKPILQRMVLHICGRPHRINECLMGDGSKLDFVIKKTALNIEGPQSSCAADQDFKIPINLQEVSFCFDDFLIEWNKEKGLSNDFLKQYRACSGAFTWFSTANFFGYYFKYTKNSLFIFLSKIYAFQHYKKSLINVHGCRGTMQLNTRAG